MVRTKADAATRVAAGGKAPRKAQNYKQHSSPPEKLGKDNLPVNRYCPRETPAWQKKITSFYDRNKQGTSAGCNQNEWPSNKANESNEIMNIKGQNNINASEEIAEYESMDMD